MRSVWRHLKRLAGVQSQPVILGYQPIKSGPVPFPRKRPSPLPGSSATDWTWRGALRAKPGPRPSPHRSARLSSLLRLACLFFVFVCSSFLLWWVPTGRSFALGSSHRLRFPNQLTCPPVKPAGSAGDGGGGSPVSSSLRSEGTGLVTKAVILSTYPPTKCGLATFAFQLRQGLLQAGLHKVDVVAVVAEEDASQLFDAEVAFRVRKHVAADYAAAAAFVGASGYETVFLQHEFGIFGGQYGEYVLEFIRTVDIPIVATLHTTEEGLDVKRLSGLTQALQWSVAGITMSAGGCATVGSWADRYGLPDASSHCRFIPHGVPRFTDCNRKSAASSLHLPGKFILLAGGLLSPAKGIEDVIQALPAILKNVPNALLVVAGQPHPLYRGNYVRELAELGARLGVGDAMRFADRYLSSAELEYLFQSAEVFVCAHTSEGQTSSGTLALAMAAGAVPVATPFAQAKEVIADGRGVLVPFKSPAAIAEAVTKLASDPASLFSAREACLSYTAGNDWPSVAAQYVSIATAAWAATQGGNVSFPLPLQPADRGRKWLPRVEVADRRNVKKLYNGVIGASSILNTGWVDGVGPGWAPVDTWISRSRAAWGEDSILLKGCFLSWKEPRSRSLRKFWKKRWRTVSVRVLEEESTTVLLSADDDGAGVMTQSWTGVMGEGRATATVKRTFTLAPQSEELRVAYEVTVQPKSRGAPLHGLRFTVAVDQLSSVSDPKYFSWTALHAPLGGAGATFELLESKPRPGLLKVANSTEGAETVQLTLSSMDSLGCSTQLTVESSSHTPPQVDLEIASSSLPHSLRHTFFAPDEDTGTKWTLEFVHKVTWRALQHPDAPHLCKGPSDLSVGPVLPPPAPRRPAVGQIQQQ